MKVLVIGQGGREHALVRAFAQSPSVSAVHALPGSDGIALNAQCHAISWENSKGVIEVVRRESIDLVVIGPDAPAASGLGDVLRADGIRVFAPSGAAAKLESSKIFAKEFMLEAGVPTARFRVVTSVEETLRVAREEFHPPYVLKADGLAAGKGVLICKTLDELRAGAEAMFDDRIFGESGARALIEEFKSGYELSYHVLTNGETYEPLPLAQDHKRLLENDEGPNTGGMGTVAPLPLDARVLEQINREVVEPTVAHLRRKGLLYRGVIFIGVMMTPQGPQVLEYNARFGDPETQVIMPLLRGDWGRAFLEIAEGRVPRLEWRSECAACVVLASEGYPDKPVRGAVIRGLDLALGKDAQVHVLHAGTKFHAAEHAWRADGGRVLNVIALGATMQEAIASTYSRAREISWEGMQMRTDIGRTALSLTKPSAY